MDLSIVEARRTCVRATVEQIRALEHKHGVTRELLELVKPELVALAARRDLFPTADFPLSPEHDGVIYRLSEDHDHRFGLFASAGRPGKARGIHNHTTWAVIAGVHGDEHNVCYERTDDRSHPEVGTLRRTGELTVRPGNAISMLPDDFHSIEVRGTQPSLHLHMYGMSHAFLPGRIGFATPEGGRIHRYPLSYSVGMIGPTEVRAMLDGGGELALLDVREEGVYSRDGHLLRVSNVPSSVLELRVPVLVPNKSTPIVVCDGNDGLAQRAAARLMKAGYKNVTILEGGIEAWAAAGHRLYTGVHVPSKAFGEYIQHEEAPPEVTATELDGWMKSGKDLVVVDSRPLAEFRRNSIPGAYDCPSAELPYRMKEFVRSADTTVVVNCGGRTRSIIGAQALINAGFPNKVYALKDGTQGWKLAGLPLNDGREEQVPWPGEHGLAWAQASAARVAHRFGIRRVDATEVQKLRSDAGRTTYLLDVRGPEEYRRGHRPGALHAPGGQLVQTTDMFIGVRPSTVIVTDNDGVRATMTAAWLVQMGHGDVLVWADDLGHGDIEREMPAPRLLGRLPHVELVTAQDLHGLIAQGDVTVADCESSLRYREGHVPGAWHVVRSRLSDHLGKIPPYSLLVFTSPDGLLATYAAADAARLTHRPVKVLDGGTAAWSAAGYDLEVGDARMTGESDDVRYRALDQQHDVETAIRAYLKWEVDLLQGVATDPDFGFRRFPRA